MPRRSCSQRACRSSVGRKGHNLRLEVRHAWARSSCSAAPPSSFGPAVMLIQTNVGLDAARRQNIGIPIVFARYRTR